jgi:hypothetical protein
MARPRASLLAAGLVVLAVAAGSMGEFSPCEEDEGGARAGF